MSAQTFHKVLNIYRQNAILERKKGDRFENLMQAYLQTGSKYAFQLTKSWLCISLGEEQFSNIIVNKIEGNQKRPQRLGIGSR